MRQSFTKYVREEEVIFSAPVCCSNVFSSPSCAYLLSMRNTVSFLMEREKERQKALKWRKHLWYACVVVCKLRK